jgi:hypothetical protein
MTPVVPWRKYSKPALLSIKKTLFFVFIFLVQQAAVQLQKIWVKNMLKISVTHPWKLRMMDQKIHIKILLHHFQPDPFHWAASLSQAVYILNWLWILTYLLPADQWIFLL